MTAMSSAKGPQRRESVGGRDAVTELSGDPPGLERT